MQNYSYDKVGNLLQRATGTLSAPGGAAELQLSAVSEGMADDLSGAEVVNYMYNANNLLTGIATDQGLMASYAYDVQGRRISKTVNGSTTHQIWDGQNIVREEMAAGAEYNYYYSRRLFAQKTGTEIRRYLYDGHGSVIGLDNVDDYDYDEDGNVIDHNNGDRYDYDAFGNLRSVTGETYNPFRYCGEYLDAESGLIYLRNRYYDPQTGRFITEDPAKDGTNWYVYCGNNPVMFVDPSGLDSYIIYEKGAMSGDRQHYFVDEANIRKKQLEEGWKTNVQMYGVSSAKEFENIWNYRVGYDLQGNDVPIEEIVIIAHGTIEGKKKNGTAQSYFYFGNRESKVYAKSNYDEGEQNVLVSNLAWKQMQYLNFSTCNSGNPDVYNLAYAFKLRMTVKQYIIAWDGGTIFDYDTGQLRAGGYDGWYKEPIRQTTWYKYVDKQWGIVPNRERIGYRQIKGW